MRRYLFSFNPHTHEGCDWVAAWAKVCWIVSIHTPTKGVTVVTYFVYWGASVSIHTPTKGVTFSRCTFCNSSHVSIHTPTKGVTCMFNFVMLVIRFQSTHPRRVWHCSSKPEMVPTVFQSTHPRRVWLISRVVPKPLICFNPHTHEGCDLLTQIQNTDYKKFQSTHPRRVWLSNHEYRIDGIEFQSTHPRRVWLHIQQIAEYHDAKIIILRKMAK